MDSFIKKRGDSSTENIELKSGKFKNGAQFGILFGVSHSVFGIILLSVADVYRIPFDTELRACTVCYSAIKNLDAKFIKHIGNIEMFLGFRFL